MFDKELKYYEKHKKRLLKQYIGKYIVIKDSKLIGGFQTEEEAYKAGLERYGNSPFLIKKVEIIEPPANIPALYFGTKNASSQ